MIKRYHEAPLALFDVVQKNTDGDYALVHLFEDNEQYYNKFKTALEKGRDVILDNSVFELKEEAFKGQQFATWIEKLQPTWYIVPDSWKNGTKTAMMLVDFLNQFPDLPGKPIGVAQGKTLEEVAQCYAEIEPYVDMVAFSLDFKELIDDPNDQYTDAQRMSFGRSLIIHQLHALGGINTEKPHHLLGCGLPQEVLWYPREWKWIRSIDTCSPIMYGIQCGFYPIGGPTTKPVQRMCDIINDPVTTEQGVQAITNTAWMEGWCR